MTATSAAAKQPYSPKEFRATRLTFAAARPSSIIFNPPDSPSSAGWDQPDGAGKDTIVDPRLGEAQKDAAMPVMSIPVHDAGPRGFMRKAVEFLHRQRVHFGPEAYDPAAGDLALDRGDDAGAGDARLIGNAEFIQPGANLPRGLDLLETDLGPGVQFLTKARQRLQRKGRGRAFVRYVRTGFLPRSRPLSDAIRQVFLTYFIN